MCQYAEEDKKVLKGRYICYYSEYLEKAREAGYNSLFQYIESLYIQYGSTRKVAHIVGVSFQTINNWLRLAGYKLLPKGGNSDAYGNKYAEGDEEFGKRIVSYPKYLEKAQEAGYNSLVQWIIVLYKKHRTIKDVGDNMGAGRTTIYNWLKIIKNLELI